jgi:hypothetical protein
MKRTIFTALLLSCLATVQAQERSSREEALKYAFFASANLKEMLATPIPTDPDIKRPVVVKDGEYGGMALPECKISPETFAKAGKEPVAVGQLWLYRLSPLQDGRVVPVSSLKIVHVSAGSNEGDVALCALAVAKGEGGPELLIYGKSKEPVMRVPLKTTSGQQENPLEFSAERRDDGGMLTLTFVGKYQASFMVTDPEQY